MQYAPAVDGRGASGFVGLKNGGATCYMNSVLQHLFLIPGVAEDILAVCSDKENEDRWDVDLFIIIIVFERDFHAYLGHLNLQCSSM